LPWRSALAENRAPLGCAFGAREEPFEDIMSESTRFLSIPSATYRERTNREAFRFEHRLADHPALKLDALREIITRLPSAQVFHSAGDVDRKQNLDRAHIEHRPTATLRDALTDLDRSGSFVMVRSPETDPELTPLLGGLLAEVDALAKEVDPLVDGTMLYLFLASPHSVTPFHIDRYSTLLMHVRGPKTVHIWEPWNADIVGDETLERYVANAGPGPAYEDRFAARATPFAISPGEGVHIPYLAPHCVEVGDAPSISLSIIFNSQRTRREAHALQFNHVMRTKLGLDAGRAHVYPARDRLKDVAVRGSYRALRLLGRA